jgi:spore germination protein YaaH
MFRTRWLLFLLLFIFVAGIFLFSRRGQKPTADEMLPGDVCTWLPWWDYQRAEEDFLKLEKLKIASPLIFILEEDGGISLKIEDLSGRLSRLKAKRDILVVPSIYNDFDGERVKRILDSEDLTEEHIERLVSLVESDDLAGIEIDYEYLPASHRHQYTQFIKALSEKLHQNRRLLAVTLHPKIAEPGEWSGAKAQDWGKLAEYADFLRVMTYDFHWEKSAPGPIAPLSWMEKVILLAREKIPLPKLVIGLGFYGYDWAEGEEGKPLTIRQAEELARAKGAEVIFATESNSPYFQYRRNGVLHTVWFENEASLELKLRLLKEFAIQNVCLWKAGDLPSDYEFFKR